MLTKEQRASKREGPTTLDREALTMAVSIVMQRIRSLGDDDKKDLCELLKDLIDAMKMGDQEEVDRITTTIQEILDRESVRVLKMEYPNEGQFGQGLQDWLKYVSEKIRTLRTEAGLSQEELAKRTGLPQSHISRLEGAKHSPSYVTRQRITKALGVDESALEPSS